MIDDSKRQEIAFVGKITAGVTHEINNVLAIIKESSGLMEDLLSLSEGNSFPFSDKFSRSLSTVQEQINRGVELVKKLNQFAHTSDEPVAQADLNRLVEQIVFLSQRFARKKKIVMHFHPSEEAIFIITNPLLLQMILFESMACFWDSMPEGSRMHLNLLKEGKEALIKAGCETDVQKREKPSPDLFSSPEWIRLGEIAGKIGGRIRCDESDFAFTLIFPGEINP